MSKRSYLFMALVAAAIALAVVPIASARSGGQSRLATTTIHVKAGEMFFKLSTKTLSKPGRVTFVVTNIGHRLHDLRSGGKQTPLIQPGKTARLTISFTKKARYPYECTVPGHAAAGMKGVFTVR